ncbi:hypothetical protein [Nocardia sp. X0981]
MAGATSAALAVAAHGATGGGYPSSAGAALLLLAAAVTGFVSGPFLGGNGHGRVRPLLFSLAGGQIAGHWALSGLTGHHTTGAAALADPAAGRPAMLAMFAAHLLAVVLCALAISGAERLYRVASAALRALLTPPEPLPGAYRANAAATDTRPRYGAPKTTRGPRAPPVRGGIDALVSFGEKVFSPCHTGFPRPCAEV